MLKTKRLLLRQWRDEDVQAFIAMNRDPEVMRWFPAVYSEKKSRKLANKIRDHIDSEGWGLWAVEIPVVAPFIGFVGLHQVDNNMPFAPAIEIGWRLNKQYWRQGYATEAAREALRYGFEQLHLTAILSMTAAVNIPSRGVMQKIGMSKQNDHFMHPGVPDNHETCEHVLYSISKTQWLNNGV